MDISIILGIVELAGFAVITQTKNNLFLTTKTT
jgi:hypothetical protein